MEGKGICNPHEREFLVLSGARETGIGNGCSYITVSVRTAVSVWGTKYSKFEWVVPETELQP